MTPLGIIASVTVQQCRALDAYTTASLLSQVRLTQQRSTMPSTIDIYFLKVLVARNSVLKCSSGCFLQRAVRFFF